MNSTQIGEDISASGWPSQELLDRMFIVCLIGLIYAANVLMGCELDLSIVWSTLKRPAAPAVGFFTQFLIMPLLAYSIAVLVLSSGDEHLLALGLFVTGCSPGGGASNYWTILLGGNVNLSITMTFLSTVGALVMMPLWIRVLGHSLVHAVSPNVEVVVPYGKIVASLVSLILPLLIGLLVARIRPNWACVARKLMRPFIVAILVFLVGLAIFNNWWLLKLITWRILLAGMLLPWCGFMFGCFSALLLANNQPDVTAIAIETGIQNTGIAIMLLKLSLPGHRGDLASLLPIVVACFTPIPLLIASGVHRMIKNIREGKKDQEKATPSTVDSQQNLLISCPPSLYAQCDLEANNPSGKGDCCSLAADDSPRLIVVRQNV